MSVQFGAAKITIDRGEYSQNFRSTRSLALREPVTDEKGDVVRPVVENDETGRKLYAAVQSDLKLFRSTLAAIDADKLELRVSREPHPEDPTNPEKDIVDILFCPNGEWQRGNPSFPGITQSGLPSYKASQLFALLFNYAKGN